MLMSVTPRLTLAAALAALMLGCAAQRTTPSSPAPVPAQAATTPAAATQAPQPTSGEELPAGRGKDILLASCTSCHELTEVTKFRGFYTRAQWRDIVVTMVEYGAPVQKNDVEVLADYLTEHLGRRATASQP